jgi:hypothetical protein
MLRLASSVAISAAMISLMSKFCGYIIFSSLMGMDLICKDNNLMTIMSFFFKFGLKIARGTIFVVPL